MKAVVFLLTFICLISRAQGESSFLTSPHWAGCNGQGICFSLKAREAATSSFSGNRMFAQKVEFTLYSQGDKRKVRKKFLAEQASSSDNQETWYFSKTRDGKDYSFDTNTMALKETPRIR